MNESRFVDDEDWYETGQGFFLGWNSTAGRWQAVPVDPTRDRPTADPWSAEEQIVRAPLPLLHHPSGSAEPLDWDAVRDLEDGEVGTLLRRRGLPEAVLAPDWVRTATPAKLTRLRAAVDALGGGQNFERFAHELRAMGISLSSYLGGGGWGEVFSAVYNGTDIAVKVFKPPYDDEWRRRLRREAGALEALSGLPGFVEHVVPPTDVQGLFFLATSLVVGTPLEDEHAMSFDEAVETMHEVTRLVGVLHSHRLLHRDLHLGNVMRTSDGLVLLDFGLARDEDAPQNYETFRPVGAMSHCAPEKWVSPSAAGRPSDIFSIGVMLYRLLTDEYPFWADTYIGLYELIRDGEMVLPSFLVDDLPAELDTVVAALMHTDPDRRVQDAETAGVLLESVARMLRLRTVLTGLGRPVSHSERFSALVETTLLRISEQVGLRVDRTPDESPWGHLDWTVTSADTSRWCYVLEAAASSGATPWRRVIDAASRGVAVTGRPVVVVTDIEPRFELRLPRWVLGVVLDGSESKVDVLHSALQAGLNSPPLTVRRRGTATER